MGGGRRSAPPPYLAISAILLSMLIMKDFYILDENKEPFPTDDHKAWAEWFSDFENRSVCRTRLIHDEKSPMDVSTVFIGIDHNYEKGDDPVLFETMTFCDDKNECVMLRYTSYEKAVSGHELLLKRLKNQGYYEREEDGQE